jgi:MFS family permease
VIPGINALKHKSFSRLFWGQAVSMLGDGLYYLVILFMTDKASNGDSRMVGLVGFATAIPFLLFGPLAGRLADRMDRRRIMILSDVFSGIITIGLAAYSFFDPTPSVWVLALVGFCLSSVNAFFAPARSASIPSLVPESSLMEANALIVSTQQMVFMLAHGISITLLSALFKQAPHIAFPVACLINATTFFGSSIFLLGLPKLIPNQEGREDAGAWKEIKEGFAVLRQNGMMAPAIMVNGICHLFISGWMVCYLATNNGWYNGDFANLALFELSFFAVIAVSSMVVSKLKLRKIGLAFSLSWICTGLLCALMAFGEGRFWIFVLLNALCGITVAFAWLPMATYLQAAFEDQVRGRVSATWNMVQMGVGPFGYAVAGPLIYALGLQGMYIFMGLGMAGSAVLGLFFKGMRNAQMPESVFAETSKS